MLRFHFLRQKFFFLVLFLLGVAILDAGVRPPQASLKAQMLKELDFIKYIFEVKYAPIEWKKKYFNFNLEEEIDVAKAKITSLDSPTVKDFQVVLKKFLDSTRDYHVKGFFYSTEFSYLPLYIQEAEGRYFIVEIDRRFVSEQDFPAQVGDELLFYNGKPIDEAIKEYRKNELGGGREDADQAAALSQFFIRSGKLGQVVPHGKAMLKIKGKKSKVARDHELQWIYIPEKIADLARVPSPKISTNVTNPFQLLEAKAGGEEFKDLAQQFFHKAMLNASFAPNKYPANFIDPKNCYLSGAKKSYIPRLGPILWSAPLETTFDAYIFQGPGGKQIGYVRIANYNGDEPQAEEFLQLIDIFNKHTDALVIDQIDNPGGNLFYVYALASMLTDKPLSSPKHRVTITQEEVEFAMIILSQLEGVRTSSAARKILGNTIGGYPVTYESVELFRKFCRFVISEWNAGHTTTGPTHMFGIDVIQPHPKAHYSKPILMLINNLDYSGGDFFPAILQGRAITLGTPTAGAGGFILNVEHPNLLGISEIVVTASIAEREDHTPLENLGVEPVIYYKLTARDLQENYIDYVNTILTSVQLLLDLK